MPITKISVKQVAEANESARVHRMITENATTLKLLDANVTGEDGEGVFTIACVTKGVRSEAQKMAVALSLTELRSHFPDAVVVGADAPVPPAPPVVIPAVKPVTEGKSDA